MVDSTMISGGAATLPEGFGPDTSSETGNAAGHRYRYQVSSSLFGRRFYLAFFAGVEKRSDERIEKDGQRYPLWRVILHFVLVACAAFGAGMLLTTMFVKLFYSSIGF